jgi:hypothetical protein
MLEIPALKCISLLVPAVPSIIIISAGSRLTYNYSHTLPLSANDPALTMYILIASWKVTLEVCI